MRKSLILVAIALFVSVPALAETTTVTTPGGTTVTVSEGATAVGGAASGAAAAISMNSVVKDGEVETTEIWNQTDGDLARSVDTIRVGTLTGSVFVNEAGCPLLFAAKYPFLPCN